MSFRYYDREKVNMLLGAIIVDPRVMEIPEAEILSEEDFKDPLHKLIYEASFNLYSLGHSNLTSSIIETYIVKDERAHSFFKKQDGGEYVDKLKEVGEPGSFVPALTYVKKMSLLRNLENNGVDVSRFFDWDTENEKTIAYQRTWLENNSLIDIANEVSDHISIIMEQTSGNQLRESIQAGEGLRNLVSSLKEEPDFGSPLAIDMLNGIVRGGRLGKFYLRSGPTGGGKSRLAMGDMANFACDTIFDPEKNQWIPNGVKEPALFISTELDLEECQTMALAFITGIDEEKILDGNCDEYEGAILEEGIRVMEESPLYFEFIPDFSIREIEGIIRTFYRENDVKYVAFDYIHSSMKFIAEISSATNGMKLREDQLLFMLATRLKDLANTLGVFIESSTQLNGDWAEATEVNQNLLRGAKSIADRLDVGMIGMRTREIDKPAVDAFVEKGYEKPDFFISFYKIRRGKYAGTKLWCKADLSTCRVRGLFVTDGSDEPIAFNQQTIEVKKLADEKLAQEESILGRKSAF